MPKIPRSRDNYATYQPSAPVLAPMNLADYSAWSDALDKGAAFAAKKYHQKQDAEANLNRNIFTNDGDNFLLEEQERSQQATDDSIKTGNASSYKELEAASEERVNQWMSKNYKEDLIGGYSTAHRSAFEITKQNIEAKAKALRLKMSANHIASVAQKQRIDWENQIITNITDPAVPEDKTMEDVRRTMKVRYELSMAGGKLESPEQFAVNQRALQIRIGKARVERYKSGFIDMIVGNYIQKKSDLFSGISDQKDVSVGKWNSYGDWLIAVKNGEYKEFFPEKTSLQLAQEINKEVQSALVTAQSARDKAGKLHADSYLNDLLVRSINTGVTPSPVEFQRLQAYFDAAGDRMPAMAFNFFNKIQTEPNANQKNYFRELEANISSEVLIASELNSPPMLTEFFKKVREGADSEALHPKGVSTLLGQLLGEQRGVNKDSNAMAGRILKMVSSEFKTWKRDAKQRDSRWKITTQLLGADLDYLVRQMTLEAYSNAQGSGKPVNESELTNTIIGNLTNSMAGRDPAKINIPRKVLADVFGKVVAHREDAKNNPLDALDKAIFRMAMVKMERNGRFLNSTLAKEYKEAIIRRGGSVYQYPTQLPAQAEKDLDEEIGFLFPGEFSYRQLYNQFFGKKEEDAVKGEQKDDQDIDLPDPNAKVEEPVVEEPVGDSTDEEAVGSVDEANLSNEQKDAAVLTEEQQNIESAPDIKMSVAPEGESAPEGELVPETSAEDTAVTNKEYYDRVDQFRAENKDMSFSQRMSKLTGAKTTEERAKYVSDWIYESDKVLNNVLGPAWADLKQSFREDNAAFGRLADAIVKEYGDPEHENPPLEELPRLMMQAVHPAAKNFNQWLRNALYGGGGIEPTAMVDIKKRSPEKSTAVANKVLPEKEVTAIRSPLVTVLERKGVSSAKPRSKSADPKEPLVTAGIRSKVVDVIKKTKKKVVSIASLGGDFFSPKKRAEDIAKLLGESWIKIDKPSLPIASKGKDKLGMRRDDAYNYMFELSVNVLRNKRISKREKDKMRDKLKKFSEMQVDSMGKSQEPVDDYVVSLVRELEMMIKAPRFFELGAF